MQKYYCRKIILILKGFGFTFTGHNKDQIEPRMLETIMKHVPAGTSTNVLVHFGQEINSSEHFIFFKNSNHYFVLHKSNF